MFTLTLEFESANDVCLDVRLNTRIGIVDPLMILRNALPHSYLRQ